jgi:hypothetical protein
MKAAGNVFATRRVDCQTRSKVKSDLEDKLKKRDEKRGWLHLKYSVRVY